ncbi:MAG: fibrobacter succinogenes major paralogous domain-containing protein [Bacteroidales bacterium]|nr:fibrobacter succinogenes major paralogous domain-containing protein [Bacteroidales bacterium]
MKSQNTILFLFILLIGLSACQEEDNPLFQTGTVTDIDGNIYNTVKIGTQWWMSENLRTTKFNDGSDIETTTPISISIVFMDTAVYQWAYLGNEAFAQIYGRLYTWYTATDERGLCPDGWHVPTDNDWTTLTDYLVENGYGNDGEGADIAKAMSSKSGFLQTGIVGVPGNKQTANNSSGFNAMPGGMRTLTGLFMFAGGDAFYWTATESDTTQAWNRLIDFDLNFVQGNAEPKNYGYSVRCVEN